MQTKREVQRAIERHLSTHHEAGDGEAYQFNIKVRRLNIPDKVRKVLSTDTVDEIFQMEASSRVEDFGQGIKEAYPWVDKVTQEGRMGGWLVVYPTDAVLDEYSGEVANIRDARARLRDLDKMSREVDEAVDQFERDLEGPEFWRPHGVVLGPKEWTPRED